MSIQPLDGQLGPSPLSAFAGIGESGGTLSQAGAQGTLSGDAISRMVPPWLAGTVSNPGQTALFGPLPGLPAASGAESYRPLSLLAMAGFGLAVFYAVAVTAGGLAVFAGRRPRAFVVLLVLAPLRAVLSGTSDTPAFESTIRGTP